MAFEQFQIVYNTMTESFSQVIASRSFSYRRTQPWVEVVKPNYPFDYVVMNFKEVTPEGHIDWNGQMEVKENDLSDASIEFEEFINDKRKELGLS